MCPNNENNDYYCKSCGNPLLYSNKPCPNCGNSNITISEENSNHAYKKPIILALMLVGIGWGINIVVSIFAALSGMGRGTHNGGIFSAFVVGSIYTSKFKEVMPKELRKWAAIYYGIIATVLAIPSMYIITKGSTTWMLLMPVFGVIEALVVYWLLGKSGKTTLKNLKKTEEMKQHNPEMLQKQKRNAYVVLTIIGLLLIAGFFFIPKKPETSRTNNTSSSVGSPKVDFSGYITNLQREIKSNWHPPKGKDSKRAVALFKVNKQGKLLSVKLVKPSGDAQTDAAAISAIRASAPFEALPEQYTENDVDINFTFDYNVWTQTGKKQ